MHDAWGTTLLRGCGLIRFQTPVSLFDQALEQEAHGAQHGLGQVDGDHSTIDKDELHAQGALLLHLDFFNQNRFVTEWEIFRFGKRHLEIGGALGRLVAKPGNGLRGRATKFLRQDLHNAFLRIPQ